MRSGAGWRMKRWLEETWCDGDDVEEEKMRRSKIEIFSKSICGIVALC